MSSLHRGLDVAALQAALGDAASQFTIEHLDSCTSTNTLLLERASAKAPRGLTLLADEQTAGRGRRGRTWFSAPGHSLLFSTLWRFKRSTPMMGLSLAVGVAVAEALEDLGMEGVGLKWPNDLWLFGHKLGGVLIELVFDADSVLAVIGCGVNLYRHPDWQSQIDQDYTAMDVAMNPPPPRELLLGSILRQLADVLARFEREGFAALQDEWNRRNALQGLPVRVSSENGEHHGICGQAMEDGTLELLADNGAHLKISGGDVSLSLDSRFNS